MSNPAPADFAVNLIENYGMLLPPNSVLEKILKNKIQQAFSLLQQTLKDLMSEPAKLEQL